MRISFYFSVIFLVWNANERKVYGQENGNSGNTTRSKREPPVYRAPSFYGPPKKRPEPFYGPPKPLYGPPKPAYGPPTPVYRPPKPVYGPPKPVYGPPKPVYGPLKPVYGPPKPVYGPPRSAYPRPPQRYAPPKANPPSYNYGIPYNGNHHYSPPAPSYGTPMTTYGAPNQNYGSPSPSYGVPNQNYGSPSATYGAPNQNYGSPSPNYGVPNQNYGSPSANYGAPNQNYGSPSANYGAPNQNYGSPSANYGAPTQTYQTYRGPSTQSYSLPSSGYGAALGNYGSSETSPNFGVPSANYGAPPQQYGTATSYGRSPATYEPPPSNYGLPTNQFQPSQMFNYGYSQKTYESPYSIGQESYSPEPLPFNSPFAHHQNYARDSEQQTAPFDTYLPLRSFPTTPSPSFGSYQPSNYYQPPSCGDKIQSMDYEFPIRRPAQLQYDSSSISYETPGALTSYGTPVVNYEPPLKRRTNFLEEIDIDSEIDPFLSSTNLEQKVVDTLQTAQSKGQKKLHYNHLIENNENRTLNHNYDGSGIPDDGESLKKPDQNESKECASYC